MATIAAAISAVICAWSASSAALNCAGVTPLAGGGGGGGGGGGSTTTGTGRTKLEASSVDRCQEGASGDAAPVPVEPSTSDHQPKLSPGGRTRRTSALTVSDEPGSGEIFPPLFRCIPMSGNWRATALRIRPISSTAIAGF